MAQHGVGFVKLVDPTEHIQTCIDALRSDGGPVNITGGTGDNYGGAVNITGGVAADAAG